MKLFSFINSGNNCYINSTLQIFLKLKNLNEVLFNYSKYINDKDSLLYQYSNIIRLYYNLNVEDETLLNPIKFYELVHSKLKFNKNQQDINEFIHLFFDYIEKEIKKYTKKDFNINQYIDYNTTSIIHCHNCNNSIPKDEKNIIFTIFIKEYPDTLQELINTSFKDNIPDYKCNKCNQKKSIKYNKYGKFNDYLLLYLCTYNQKNKIKQPNNFKINDNIIINKVSFKPISIINHFGSLRGGHYINHSLNYKRNWARINDSNISYNNINKERGCVLILLEKN
jgi:uncharacterized UBP type Zn finger protein